MAPDTARHYGDPASNTAVVEPKWVESTATDLPPPIGILATDGAGQAPPPVSPRRSPAPQDDAREVSFLNNDEKPSIWRRPMTRLLLLLLVALLLAALGVQVLLRERDRIAASAPAMRPVLLAICAWARCDLSAPRQIESVVIDSSSFKRVRGDNYALAFSLRNNAAIQLAMPAIELALTDAQDQAVIRRVILPNEFGAASALLGANAEWAASLLLNVKTVATGDRISGYRLLVFYP